MKPLDVGRLNKRITFLKRRETGDEYGSHFEWEPAFSAWATVSPERTSEPTLRNDVQKPQAGFKIYMRYRKGICPDMRILYGDRLLEIAGPPVDLEERNAVLQISAEEVFEDGEYGS